MKILITGGTNGIGKGVSKILASRDHQKHEIIILCRSYQLGEDTIQEIKKETKNSKISIVLCDLAKLSQVKQAIREIQEKHSYLDGIFINAGIGYAPKRIETEDGMDSHFQVNYLAQFMLLLNLLTLLEASKEGGRVIFNATETGKIFWQDIQMKDKWSYEDGIHQAMAAKRMLLLKLDRLYKKRGQAKVSFIGFQIDKIVWSNQINLIPKFMRIMVGAMRLFGKFISIEKCGEMMAPLFCESRAETEKRSGKLISWIKSDFVTLKEEEHTLDPALQERLWNLSLDLCADPMTQQIGQTFAE